MKSKILIFFSFSLFLFMSCSNKGSSSSTLSTTNSLNVNLKGNFSNIQSFESIASVASFRIYALSTNGSHHYADIQNDGSFNLNLRPSSLYLLYLLKDADGDGTYEELISTFDAVSGGSVNLFPLYKSDIDLGTLNIPSGGAGSILSLLSNPASGNDMDSDGTSDELDKDIDGNGLDDTEDLASIDIDGDNSPNPIDNDMDGDGILNVYDSNTIDPSSSPEPYEQDSDGDGIMDSNDIEPTSLNGDLPLYFVSGNISYIDPREAITAVALTTQGRFIRSSVTSTGNFSLPLREGEAFLLYFMNENVVSNSQNISDFRGIVDPLLGAEPNLMFIGKKDLNLGSLTLPINPESNSIFVRRSIFTARDTDEDNTPDSSDTDANGNGILDTNEVIALNFDGDKLPNVLDRDDDNDGILDSDDSDKNADGLPDPADIDGDGIPDSIDVDIDNDGQIDGSNPSLLPAPDLEAPLVDTALSFPAPQIQDSSIRISWDAARDNATSTSDLEYKIVRADNSASIDTPDEANSISGDSLVQDWTPNITQIDATGLLYPHTYFFSVIVRDDAGNMSIYAPQSQSTEDHTPPVAGSSIVLNSPSPGNHNIVVNWGAASDNASIASNLSYKIVQSTLLDASDIDSLEEAIISQQIAMNWSKDITSYNVTGLSEFQIYSFAVIVKDENNNMAFYPPNTIKTLDETIPTIPSNLHFSSLTSSGVTINWSAANDADPTLSYKVVQTTAPQNTSDIDTVAEALNALEVMPWTQNILSTSVSGLTQNTSYSFAILVKDTSGNTNIYAPQSITSIDSTAPLIGIGATFDSINANDISLSWTAASDDFTQPALLEYKVVSALSPDEIDSVEEAELAPDISRSVILPWSADTYNTTATSLSSGASYSYTILVKDGDGKISIYSPNTARTLDNVSPTPGSGPTLSDTQVNQITVNWSQANDNLSTQNNLEYKVLRSSSSSLIDEASEENAEISHPESVSLVMDWTQNITSATATSLSGNTPYFFSVFVRDELNQVSVYSPVANGTTLDGTVPLIEVPADNINATGITTTGSTLQWGSASDNLTSPGNLKYKIVKVAASNGTSLDTVSEADAITTTVDGLVMDWTLASALATAPDYLTPTVNVSGLTSSTQYYFAVLVKDEAENKNIYPVKTITTSSPPDLTAPTLGNAISFTNTYDTKTIINWGLASDNVSSQSNLQYKIVRANNSADIDSVEKADGATPTLVRNWSNYINPASYSITGLSANTSYSFAILVKDLAGNKALYAPVSLTTASAMKFLFVTGASYKGNFGMSNADNYCNTEGKSRLDSTKTYKALLVGGSTRKACTNANCSSGLETEHINWVLAPNTQYKDKNGTPIGTTTSNKIFNFPLTQGIDPTLASNVFIWTGLNADWTSSNNTCSTGSTPWVSIKNGIYGQSGSPLASNSNSIKSATLKACKNTSARLYCVEQ